MKDDDDLQEVRSIVRREIAKTFPNDIEFGPIVVHHSDDDFDENDQLLQILLIFNGDQKQLDPSAMISLLNNIHEELLSSGVDEFPITSFIEKSEWDQMFVKWRRLHPSVHVET